jgi:hypothetical protein
MVGNLHHEGKVEQTGFIQLKSLNLGIRLRIYKIETIINCSNNELRSDGEGSASQNDG